MNSFALRNKKIIVSVVMALMMVLAMVPSMAFADEGDATTGSFTGTISAPATVYIGAPVTLAEPTNTANGVAHVDWSVTNNVNNTTGAATISKHNGQLVGSAAGTVTVTATLVSGEKVSGSGSSTGTGGSTPCEGTTLATLSVNVTIAAQAEGTYGYQGEGGNTLFMEQIAGQDLGDDDVDFLDKDTWLGKNRYNNEISPNVVASSVTSNGTTLKKISFGYTMGAGINNFNTETFNGYNSQIGIYSADGNTRLADVELAVDSATVIATRIVTIQADVTDNDKFENNTSYILRFGPNVCGNNTSKNLNCYIDFMFTLSK